MLKDPQGLFEDKLGKAQAAYTLFIRFFCNPLKSICQIKVNVNNCKKYLTFNSKFVGTSSESEYRKELILVLEGDLYLVPFPVLRSASDSAEYLCERYSLFVIPNLLTLRSTRTKKHDSDQQVRQVLSFNIHLILCF